MDLAEMGELILYYKQIWKNRNQKEETELKLVDVAERKGL